MGAGHAATLRSRVSESPRRDRCSAGDRQTLAFPPGERATGPRRPEDMSCFYFMLNNKCFSKLKRGIKGAVTLCAVHRRRW